VSDSDSVDSLGSTALKWLAGFFDKLIFDETGAPSTPASGDVALYAKTGGNLYSKDDAGLERIVSNPDYIHIREEQSSGTSGGGFTSGSPQTRILNTIVSDVGSHASLASNQITLASGTYEILAFAPGFVVNGHIASLYNISDAAIELTGQVSRAGSAALTMTHSILSGRFTIASSKIFELRHECVTTKTVDGFGQAQAFGEVEVYTTVILRKVA
jgi:hypothetical protein